MALDFLIESQIKTYATFSGFPTTGAEKTIYIDESTSDAYYWNGSSYLQIRTESKYEAIDILNNTGASVPKMSVCYIKTSSSSANTPEILLSNASTEATSSKTIGLLMATTPNGSTGKLITAGEYDKFDTSAYNVGDRLWLSTTDGQMTTTIPSAPNHAVFIGIVTRKQSNNGRILVAIQNGYELEELHDVTTTNYTTPNNADSLLILDNATSLWKRLTWANLKTTLSSVFQAVLVSGTNIKTVNSTSLLGSGDVAVQATLVSGTNIKTIEGQSLLGGGNIDLSKSDVGLGNVDNTSDANKPISTATQTALNAKQATIFNARSFGTQSNSVGETQMAQITIPANTFASTDKLAFFAFFNKVGTANAATIRFKISTSASMPTGATSQIALYTLANTSLFSKVNREFMISGGTLRGFPFATSTNNDATVSTTAMGSVAFDPTVTQYFYISVSPSASTADITYLEGFEIKQL
jgi:hypothetical protein